METQLVRIASAFIVVLTLALMPVTVSAPESPSALNHAETTDSVIPSAHTLTQSGSVSAASTSTKPAAQARLIEGLGKLPLYFVENQGQLDERVAYYIQGSDKTIYFSPGGVTFALTDPTPRPCERRGACTTPLSS
jgi:hypothetical protein